jgi:hypothetical protein
MRKSLITALISIFIYGIVVGSTIAHAPTWFIVTTYVVFAIALGIASWLKLREELADMRAGWAKLEAELREKYKLPQ